jgi:predicted SAM-dependent methyltransferase
MTLAVADINWKDARLHLGCGSHRLDGWVNADGVQTCATDLVLDICRDLAAVPAGALAGVYWCHGPEHVAPDLLPGVLVELHRALAPGGRLTVATIDLNGIYHGAYAKGYLPEHWNAYLYGDARSTDHPFLAHKQCFTAPHLGALLCAAGFATVAPWALDQYPEIHALNDCARSSYHVTLYLEGVK